MIVDINIIIFVLPGLIIALLIFIDRFSGSGRDKEARSAGHLTGRVLSKPSRRNYEKHNVGNHPHQRITLRSLASTTKHLVGANNPWHHPDHKRHRSHRNDKETAVTTPAHLLSVSDVAKKFGVQSKNHTWGG